MIKACPRIPININQESSEGTAHKKFKPTPIIRIVRTNRLLDGMVKRAVRKLDVMDAMAFWLRTNIPSDEKKIGTTSHMETNPIKIRTAWPINELNINSRDNIKAMGMPKIQKRSDRINE